MFFLCGIRHLVVERKIIRKVNDNDDGRALFNGRGRCYVSAFAFEVRRSVKLY